MNRIELAWAAGFFDGEGSTVLAGANSRRVHPATGRRRDYPTPSVSISQHNTPECLERFRAAVGGVGRIDGPRIYRQFDSPRWTYAARTHESAQAVVAALWPFLSTPKRDQAHAVFLAYNVDAQGRRRWSRKSRRNVPPPLYFDPAGADTSTTGTSVPIPDPKEG